MQIQVLVNFGGVETGEKRILPGIYHHNDPAIFNLARYLVEGGWAKVVTDSDGRAILNETASLIALGELIAEERMIAKAVGVKSVAKLNWPPDAETENEIIAENLEELKSLEEDKEIVVDFDRLVEEGELRIDDTTISVASVATTSLHGLGIPATVLKALNDADIHTLEEVAALSDDELLAIDGVGHAAIKKLRGLIVE